MDRQWTIVASVSGQAHGALLVALLAALINEGIEFAVRDDRGGSGTWEVHVEFEKYKNTELPNIGRNVSWEARHATGVFYT